MIFKETTRTITVDKAAEVMCEAKQVAFIDHDSFFLAITSPNFCIVNPNDANKAKYVFCTSTKELGDGQKRYVYLAEETEIAEDNIGVVYAPDSLIKSILEMIKKQEDSKDIGAGLFGVFPIQPEFGAQYSDEGIELFRLLK